MLRLDLFFPGVIDRIGLHPRGRILIIAEIDLADVLWGGAMRNASFRYCSLYFGGCGLLDVEEVDGWFVGVSSMDGGSIHYIY